MTRLTLQLALRVIEGAFAKATELQCVPLTVVVLDAGGHEVAVQRQDRSGILRVDIARAKAWSALGMGYASREIAERAPAAGGVLLYDDERNVIGAVGISGDTSDRDEECALAGVKAAGLQA